MSSIKRRWLTFPCRSFYWYPALTSLEIKDMGISANTISNGDKLTFWNMPLLTFTLLTFGLPNVNSIFRFSMLLRIAYSLQPQTSRICSSNYGGPCHMPSCSLSMSFESMSAFFSITDIIVVHLNFHGKMQIPLYSILPVHLIWEPSSSWFFVAIFLNISGYSEVSLFPFSSRLCP